MKRVAVYYRVSTKKQDTDSQRHDVEIYLKTLGPISVRVFEDHGVSGTKDDRDGFRPLQDAVAAQEIDMIVVWALDRISRRSSHAIRTILGWKEAGVEFVPVSQPHLATSAANPFQNTLLAAFADLAELERYGTIKRIKAGISAAKAANGGKWGRRSLITEDQLGIILALKGQGWTQRKIAQHVGIPLATVNRAILKQRDSDACQV